MKRLNELNSYYLLKDSEQLVDEAISDLQGFSKTISILYLSKVNIPILKGIIITRWNMDVEKTIYDFCNKNNFPNLLLRHDKRPEIPPYPRGGYLVSIDNIKAESLKYFNENRIVIWLEPANYLVNLYSINIMFDANNYYWEVVGPGFDASDLQRGDQSPHEYITIDRYSGKILDRSVPGHNNEYYKNSVHYRLIKIGKKVMSSDSIDNDQYIEHTVKYLKEKNYTLLLENINNYKMIPCKFIKKVHSHTHNLPEKLEGLISVEYPFVLSCGFVNKNYRLIFWDITWPKKKFNWHPKIINKND